LPSWKIQTIAPNDADSDSTFISSALAGSTKEPKATNSSTNVISTMNPAIHGARSASTSSRSTSEAVSPPTSTEVPGGAATARTPWTTSRAGNSCAV
jgi:hypothetical protein